MMSDISPLVYVGINELILTLLKAFYGIEN